ncbi:MAG: ACT domain-containing protein [Candidatus Wildermuthbacteria bacterium]|nr:ACT domain-containing protein [Candidatus Wildermuthbacteria bacterium]
MRKVEDYLRNGEIYVWKETFSIAKAKGQILGAFAAIHDKNENTVIIDQAKLQENEQHIEEADKDWKIITFDMLLPIDMVGFIATISGALAQEGISILWVSAFSTDHVLIQQNDLAKALLKLQSLGCRIKEK